MNERIAILPGSFDPPTRGHVSLIEEALRQNDVDHVVVVAVHNPTKKKRLLDVENSLTLLKKMLPADIADRVTLSDSAKSAPRLATEFNAAAVIRGKRDIDPPRKTFIHETAVAAYFTAHRILHLKKPLQIKWLTSPVQGMSSTRLRQTLFSDRCSQERLEKFLPADIARTLMQAKIKCPDVSKDNSAGFNRVLAEALNPPPKTNTRRSSPGLKIR